MEKFSVPGAADGVALSTLVIAPESPKAVSMARESSENAREEVEKTGVKIVFEDDDYLVVDKPTGLLTVSNKVILIARIY